MHAASSEVLRSEFPQCTCHIWCMLSYAIHEERRGEETGDRDSPSYVCRHHQVSQGGPAGRGLWILQVAPHAC